MTAVHINSQWQPHAFRHNKHQFDCIKWTRLIDITDGGLLNVQINVSLHTTWLDRIKIGYTHKTDLY